MSSRSDLENPLSDSSRELDRIQKQHRWIQRCLRNQIVFAPVQLSEEGLRILDIGCADGALLRDLQKSVPSSTKLVGVDLMESYLPPSEGNLSFQVYDICDPPSEDLVESFDLTHLRLVLAGSAKVGLAQAVKNIAATVAPGGWLQVQEMDMDPDRPVAGPAWRDVNSCIAGVIDALGVGADYAHRVAQAFEGAGLENVSTQVVDWPMGKLLGEEEAATSSSDPWVTAVPAIIQASKAMKANIPDAMYDNLPERFQEETREQGALFRSILVIGQKPT